MEPMKPEQKQAVLANRPQAQPSDLEEYERLLSLRFSEDPDAQPAMAPAEAGVASEFNREARITELHRKLFGTVLAPV